MNLTPFLKSRLVSTDQYLLTVYRYIERNPVRAHMAQVPEHYPWSSVQANLGLKSDPLVTPHETFLSLANDSETRHTAYRAWLREAVSDDEAART